MSSQRVPQRDHLLSRGRQGAGDGALVRAWLGLGAALLGFLLTGCGGDDGSQSSAKAACPDGGEPLTAVFDLGESPRTYSSQWRAVDRFLAQHDVELEPGDFSRSGGRATFTADSESTGPVLLYVERIDGGWIITSYEACRGVV